MEALFALLITLTYPLLILLIPEPIAASESWRAGKVVFLSGLLKEKSQRNGRWLLLIQLGATLIVTRCLLRMDSISPEALGIAVPRWGNAIGLGLVGCVVLLILRYVFETSFPRLRQFAAQHPMLCGSQQMWVIIILLSAIVEEFWRASCIESLGKAGFGASFSLTASSFCYALAQISGVPARLVGIWEDFVSAFAVGALLAILFFVSHAVFINALSNLSFKLTFFFVLRGQIKRL